MYYVHVLQNKETGKLYTGYTANLLRRVKEHKNGNTQTTKTLKTNELIFYEVFINKMDAIRREKYFKTTKGKSSLRQTIRKSLL